MKRLLIILISIFTLSCNDREDIFITIPSKHDAWLKNIRTAESPYIIAYSSDSISDYYIRTISDYTNILGQDPYGLPGSYNNTYKSEYINYVYEPGLYKDYSIAYNFFVDKHNHTQIESYIEWKNNGGWQYLLLNLDLENSDNNALQEIYYDYLKECPACFTYLDEYVNDDSTVYHSVYEITNPYPDDELPAKAPKKVYFSKENGVIKMILKNGKTWYFK